MLKEILNLISNKLQSEQCMQFIQLVLVKEKSVCSNDSQACPVCVSFFHFQGPGHRPGGEM